MKDSFAPSRDATLTAMQEAFVWAEPPTLDFVAAAITDNTAISENALMTYLDKREQVGASAIPDPMERRHYIFRRCFQRIFVGQVLNWGGALSELVIDHQLDTAPRCPDAPDLRLSFSSSGPIALACASRQHDIGIDIEKQRDIDNVVALAHRFFEPEEAAAIADLPGAEQSYAFLEHWTAKEAGLKTIGKGIVSGLNSFVLKRHKNNYNIDFIAQSEANVHWKLEYLSLLPHHIIAVVHSNVAVVHNLEN